MSQENSDQAAGFVARRRPGTPLVGEATVIRLATADDADVLVRWHADPQVARYWGGETYSRDQILVRLARADVDSYIVEATGEPVGFLQAWFGEADAAVGLDMFLIPTARGRGFGPDAARTLARWLLRKAGPRRVTVDPERWNEAAIRSWQRAGFRAVQSGNPMASTRTVGC